MEKTARAKAIGSPLAAGFLGLKIQLSNDQKWSETVVLFWIPIQGKECRSQKKKRSTQLYGKKLSTRATEIFVHLIASWD